MDIYAFFSELTLREIRTVFLGMYVGTFLVCIVTVRPMPTPDLLFVLQQSLIFLLICLFQSDVVFVLA